MEALRREVDRLFEDFGAPGFWRPGRGLFEDPFFQRSMTACMSLAVDIVEKDASYEVTPMCLASTRRTPRSRLRPDGNDGLRLRQQGAGALTPIWHS
jgi:hypothetical protein